CGLDWTAQPSKRPPRRIAQPPGGVDSSERAPVIEESQDCTRPQLRRRPSELGPQAIARDRVEPASSVLDEQPGGGIRSETETCCVASTPPEAGRVVAE